MTDIFVSYAHQDYHRVSRIVKRLRESGWQVWWDEQLTPGRNFDDAIEERIMAAKCVVVVWSKHSVNSEWVKNEAMVGLERGCLVPVMLDSVSMPLTFRRTHAIDLGTGHGRHHYDNFINAVRNTVEGTTTFEAIDSHQPQAIRKPLMPILATLVAILIFITAAYITVTKYKEPAIEITTTAMALVLAVLPFHNLSNDADNEFFAAGMHEEIIARMSRLESLSVIARTSVMKYQDSNKTIREISNELKADLVMEGSVRFDGNNVRITAQLIDATDSSHVWSEIYDGKLEDIFAVQTDVANNLARIIGRATGTNQPTNILNKGLTENPTAYVNYLVGKHHLDRGRPDLALQSFQSAVELDPKFAAAFVGLAQYWLYQMFWYSVPAETALPEYLRYQKLAYEADRNDPQVMSLTMFALLLEKKVEDAEIIRQQLMEHARGPSTFESLARWPAATYDERAKWQAQAVALDPQNTATRWRLSQYLTSARDFDAALEHMRLCNALEANPYLLSTTAEILLHLGRKTEANKLFDSAIKSMEERLINDVPERFDAVSVLSQLVFMHGKRGNTGSATKHLAALETIAAQQYVGPSNMVVAYQGVENIEKIAPWISRWIDQEGYWFQRPYLLENPRLDFMRGSKEFDELLLATAHLP